MAEPKWGPFTSATNDTQRLVQPFREKAEEKAKEMGEIADKKFETYKALQYKLQKIAGGANYLVEIQIFHSIDAIKCYELIYEPSGKPEDAVLKEVTFKK